VIIGMDTSGPVIGVGLLAGEVRLTKSERVSRGSETRLIPWLIELTERAGVLLPDCEGIAIAQGPGAFTGVRVGLSTAVGLAMSLNVPALPVMSLQPRAEQVRLSSINPQGFAVLSMLDARKGRVYAALYTAGGELVEGPADIDPVLACGWAKGPFVATGEGSLVYRQHVEEAQGVVVAFAEDPALERLCELGRQSLLKGKGCDPFDLRPLYLRAPDAKPPAPSSFGGSR
jgi:tRNA threonylcarbamoyladenosine biosynthesis protein TsaB